MELIKSLQKTVDQLNLEHLSDTRKEVLRPMIDYIVQKRKEDEEVKLNFICTHNSRRSQLSQIWAQTAAYYYGVKAQCFSGGVEVTAFNPRAIASVERMGFRVSAENKENPKVLATFAADAEPVLTFSKLYSHEANPDSGFVAIMTCSHADENCPFIAGADKRIPVRYDDPKEYDGTALEAQRYDERSLEIATEMFYVFSKVK